MVVAVIPRPEPMLRGEDGRGTPLPRPGPGSGAPSPSPVRGSTAPSPSGLGPRRPLPPPPAWGPGELLLRPLQGLESGASPNSPSPTPVQGLEPSIHTRRVPDLPVPERPLDRAQPRRLRSPAPRRESQTRGPVCVLGLRARRWARQPGVRRDPEDAAPQGEDFQGPPRRKLSWSPSPPPPLHPGPSTCVSHRCQLLALRG